MGYYKILNIVSCAIQEVLVVHTLAIQQCVSDNPQLLVYPSSSSFFPFGNSKFAFYVYESVSVL